MKASFPAAFLERHALLLWVGRWVNGSFMDTLPGMPRSVAKGFINRAMGLGESGIRQWCDEAGVTTLPEPLRMYWQEIRTGMGLDVERFPELARRLALSGREGQALSEQRVRASPLGFCLATHQAHCQSALLRAGRPGRRATSGIHVGAHRGGPRQPLCLQATSPSGRASADCGPRGRTRDAPRIVAGVFQVGGGGAVRYPVCAATEGSELRSASGLVGQDTHDATAPAWCAAERQVQAP